MFREIRLTDELGSGIRNTYRYTGMYSEAKSEFVERDIFRIILPLSEVTTAIIGPVSPTTDVSTEASTEVGGEVSTEVTTQVGMEVKLEKKQLGALVNFVPPT